VNFYGLEKPENMNPGSRLKAIDPFSGAGGITLGLRNAGFDVIFCSDCDVAREQTHRRNFPRIPFMRMATDVRAMVHWALEIAPRSALSNIDSGGGFLYLLAKRLHKFWPELARGIVVNELHEPSINGRSANG
jgi:hypothetical protein